MYPTSNYYSLISHPGRYSAINTPQDTRRNLFPLQFNPPTNYIKRLIHILLVDFSVVVYRNHDIFIPGFLTHLSSILWIHFRMI